MNMNRPDMTEDVKSKDYTNKSLHGLEPGYNEGVQIPCHRIF